MQEIPLQQQAEKTGFGTMAEIMPGAPLSDEDLPERPTLREVARWLGRSYSNVRKLVLDGAIPCKRIKRKRYFGYVFDKKALLKWARPKQEAA